MQEKSIEVSHQEILSTIGVSISPDVVQKYLLQLGFGIEIKHAIAANEQLIYRVIVPTYRATKDVTIKQDIIEEIARFYGYENIPTHLPSRQMHPFDMHRVMRTRQIKRQLAFGSRMNEVQTYAFYDEPFLKELGYEPKQTLQLAQPFSENIKQLVTSLIPNLLACVKNNSTKQEDLRFFEIDRVWFNDQLPVESEELAGIFYLKKKKLDFYWCKAQIDELLASLGLQVSWQKPSSPQEPWYMPHQSAELVWKGQVIGTAGVVSSQLLQRLVDGEAFIFEINGDFILNARPETHSFKPLRKYQEVQLDMSLMVPSSVTVATLEKTIDGVDNRIEQVRLLDFFERPEWHNQKSVTLRFIVSDAEKTLVKEEIDDVYDKVVSAVTKLGAEIR